MNPTPGESRGDAAHGDLPGSSPAPSSRMTATAPSRPAPARRELLLLSLLATASVVAKLLLARVGASGDVAAFRTVGDLVLSGKNVWVATHNYNYGPIWLWVEGGLRWLSLRLPGEGDLATLHLLYAGLLALVDVALAAVAYRELGRVAAIVLLANPAAVLLTGYHSQFDPLAVLVGLAGVLVLRPSFEEPRPGRSGPVLLGSLLLGVSLMVKHILAFLPAWLALAILFRRRRLLDRDALLVALVPPLVFLGSFLPWAFDPVSRQGIVDHVFRYDSLGANGFLPRLAGVLVPPGFIGAAFGEAGAFAFYKRLFIVLMLLLGVELARRRTGLVEFFALYLVGLVVTSSAMANQYLAIPFFALAVWPASPLLWIYVAVTTGWLLLSPENVGSVLGWVERSPLLQALDADRWRPVFILFLFLVVRLARPGTDRPGRAGS